MLVSEIFPNRMRAQGMSIAVGCMWVANFAVSQSFPMINDHPYLFSHFHGAFPMWIFAACCLFSYWFIGRYIPETKGVSLEKWSRWCWPNATVTPCRRQAAAAGKRQILISQL